MQNMQQSKKRRSTGIDERHTRHCRTLAGGSCSCRPSYRAWVYDARSGRKIRRTFPTRAAARSWRTDALSLLQRGQLMPTSSRTLREAAHAWLEGANAEPPVVLSRSGQRYKPSVLRGYAADLRNHVLPELGNRRLADVRRGDLQTLVDRQLGRGLSASKVRNVLMPVRAIYRHALERDEVVLNPTRNLRLPTGLGIRDRVATVTEAEALFAALPEVDRALWATAFYAGLRLGELRALRWSDVDLAAGLIRVERGWDEKAGYIAPKSAKGRRSVPIMGALRRYLERQGELTGRAGTDLVFGSTSTSPFTPSHLRKRALKAWAVAAIGAFLRGESLPIELRPIGFHELRHSFVSFAAAAVGPNGERLKPEEVADMVGHSSVYMTERYRHEFDGRTESYAGVLDNYHGLALARQPTKQHSAPAQPQPNTRVRLLAAFEQLLDGADPGQLLATSTEIHALLDERIRHLERMTQERPTEPPTAPRSRVSAAGATSSRRGRANASRRSATLE